MSIYKVYRDVVSSLVVEQVTTRATTTHRKYLNCHLLNRRKIRVKTSVADAYGVAARISSDVASGRSVVDSCCASADDVVADLAIVTLTVT